MIEILCGPIGCGKSTYASDMARKGYLIINDDAIVKMVHGGNYMLYDKKLKPLYKSIENTILTTGLLLNRDIIVDRPNYSKEMRQRYISLARSWDHEVKCVLWESQWANPEMCAKLRFAKDNRGWPYEEWVAVATRHHKLYERPSLEEGIQEIIIV